MTLAQKLGFSEDEGSRLALAITEAATNLVKHARQGELLLQALSAGSRSGLEVLALDSGPGMKDIGRCLSDGYSTAGSPGTGLGAMKRLASEFEIYSDPAGTVLLTRFWAAGETMRDTPAAVPRLEVGAVNIPYTGEPVCGDAWAIESTEAGAIVLVVDGLGHGQGAADAAREAVRAFCANARLDPVSLVKAIHGAIRATRGAALAIASLDLKDRTVRYAGVGNIAGMVLSGTDVRSMVSQNGTVGHTMQSVQEFVYPFPEKALLIMHSDGLLSRWQLQPYAGLAVCHPGLIAGVLCRDFNRGRDDVTVVAVRPVEAMEASP
jgi:anti-sigma regulatory factor (Ser/Thr protein kinase)